MKTRSVEPERELVRRLAPFGPPAAVVSLLVGALAGGWSVGWSAAIGVVIVFANQAVNGLVLAWAAGISLVAYSAAVMGGFVARMAAIVAVMFGLNRLAFFSPLAFGLAAIPATVLLLSYELKLLAGGLGRELRLPTTEPQASP